jgi:hypothetical protein
MLLGATKTMPERALEGVTLLLCALAVVWAGLLMAAGESLDNRQLTSRLLHTAHLVRWPGRAGWSPAILYAKVALPRQG